MLKCVFDHCGTLTFTFFFFFFHLRVWLYKASDGPNFDEQRCEITKDILLQVRNNKK